jgi:hypothetical protein
MTMRPSAALAMPYGLSWDDAAFETPLIAAVFSAWLAFSGEPGANSHVDALPAGPALARGGA